MSVRVPSPTRKPNQGSCWEENFVLECPAVAGGWEMAQVASDRPFPHPSVQGVPGPAIHTTVGLCDMRLACPSDDIRIPGLPFEALYPNSSI